MFGDKEVCLSCGFAFCGETEDDGARGTARVLGFFDLGFALGREVNARTAAEEEEEGEDEGMSMGGESDFDDRDRVRSG